MTRIFLTAILFLSGQIFAQKKSVTFSAMGCGPYNPAAEQALRHQIHLENQNPASAFIIHCGDIVTGKFKNWPESQFEKVADILSSDNKIPTFIVPGDNEWNDQENPDQSWKHWEKHFLKLDEKWTPPAPVSRQEKRPENFVFVIDGVLFIGINKVGGLVHDKEEWELRLVEDAEWIVEQFIAHRDKTHAAVIFAQAAAFSKNVGQFPADLKTAAVGFGHPILYLHADGHKWTLEEGKWADNITRLQLDVVNGEFPPVQVTVSDDPANPFSFDRRRDKPEWRSKPDSFHWSFRAGGEGNDKIRGACATADGGAFVTGEISGDTDFGPHRLKSAGSLDFILAKIDKAGHVIWARRAGGAEIDRGYAVSPAEDGGCFVTGHFQSKTITFGDNTLTNSGDYDGYIARYDKTGLCLWAKRFGGENYDFGHGISTAPDGNVVVSGTIANLGDLGGETIGKEKSRSAVVAKYSPAGEIIWSRAATGPGNSGHNVAVGKDGSIYLAGFGRGKIEWSDTVSTESKIQDISLSKYNSAGELQWVKTTGGESDGAATGVSVDEKTGNVCLSGMFKGTARFGNSEFVSHGGNDFFAAVFSPDGECLNAHHGGGAETDYALGSDTLSDGSGFVITGEITKEAQFNGEKHTATGERDAYILTLSPDGSSVKSFMLAGGKDHDLSYAIAAATDGGIFISGAFRNETQFGATSLTAKKGNDIFVAKFYPATNE